MGEKDYSESDKYDSNDTGGDDLPSYEEVCDAESHGYRSSYLNERDNAKPLKKMALRSEVTLSLNNNDGYIQNNRDKEFGYTGNPMNSDEETGEENDYNVNCKNSSDSRFEKIVIESSLSGFISVDSPYNKIKESGTYEQIDYKAYRWHIRDWNSVSKLSRVYSENFLIGHHVWRVLMFPKGGKYPGFVSLFLDCVEFSGYNHICAKFCLSMSNSNRGLFLSKEAHHRFNPSESDWGFSKFIEIEHGENVCLGNGSVLSHNVDSLTLSELVENNQLFVNVFVKVVEDKTGSLWQNQDIETSREETGYVGLKNQGATCYMNSYLQTLYLISAFRKAVYLIPTENDDVCKSISLALQKCFYLLEKSPTAVGTRELTQSFGWDTYDSFLQRDIQEFGRILHESLENKIKETPSEGIINELFVCDIYRYLKCLNVPFESSGIEKYHEIPLMVKGMKGVMDSFRFFTTPDMLQDDNKFDCGSPYGYQDAKLGFLLKSLSPVIVLQLSRFEYDYVRDMTIKINDRYEFPSTMDLSEFMVDSNESKVCSIYHLFGVLVHSGNVGGGHYYSFFKDHQTKRWLRFDDEKVTFATEEEAICDNFGGPRDRSALNTKGNINGRLVSNRFSGFTSAYMLVYIRECDIDRVLAPVEEKYIPKHVVEMCEKGWEEKKKLELERQQFHLYLNVVIATDAYIRDNEELGIVDNLVAGTVKNRKFHRRSLRSNLDIENDDRKGVDPYVLRLKKNDTILDVKENIKNEYEIPVEDQRYWLLSGNRNHGMDRRIDSAVVGPVLEKTRLSEFLKKEDANLYLYLETRCRSTNSSMTGDMLFTSSRDCEMLDCRSLLVCVKTYHPFSSNIQDRLSYLLSLEVKKTDVFCVDFVPRVVEALNMHVENSENFEYEKELVFYEEVSKHCVRKISYESDTTLEDLNINTGSIIVIQIGSDSTISERRDRVDDDIMNFQEYISFIGNRVFVTFKPHPHSCLSIMDSDNPLAHEFVLELSTHMRYPSISKRVTQKINEICRGRDEKWKTVDKDCIRFSQHDGISGTVKKTPISPQHSRSDADGFDELTLEEMFPKTFYMSSGSILYYEVLGFPLKSLSDKLIFKIWSFSPTAHTKRYDMIILSAEERFESGVMMKDMLQELRKVDGNSIDTIWSRYLEESAETSEYSNVFRILEISNNGCTIIKEYIESNVIENYHSLNGSPGSESDGHQNYSSLYLELIPMDEYQIIRSYLSLQSSSSLSSMIHHENKDRVIRVFSFYKTIKHSHGIPFKFVLRKDEKFSKTKERLSKKLNMSPKSLSRCNFVIVGSRTNIYLNELPEVEKLENGIDDLVLTNLEWLPHDQLAIDHIDKSYRHGRHSAERAMKIM